MPIVEYESSNQNLMSRRGDMKAAWLLLHVNRFNRAGKDNEKKYDRPISHCRDNICSYR